MNAAMAAPSQHVLGIDPKMYRHFAALTLVISLSTAFFANGLQSREAPSEQPAKAVKPDPKSHAPRSEMDVLNGTPPDPAPAKAGGTPPPPPPSIAEGPIDPVAGDDGQFTPKPARFAYRRPPLRADPALLAKMTPEQRAGYLKALALQDQSSQNGGAGAGGGGGGPGGAGPAGPSQQQIDRLVSASRARSGGGD